MPSRKAKAALSASTLRLLARLDGCGAHGLVPGGADIEPLGVLAAADLARKTQSGRFVLTDAGKARLRREAAAGRPEGLEPFRAQHVSTATILVEQGDARTLVQMNDGESPLVWLARRKGKDGQPLISAHQLLAGERLRAEFTRAQMMPRVTADWSGVASSGRGAGRGAASVTEAALAARQGLQSALTAVGPEFAGLLLDVCCFLKRLEEVEQERFWPVRSAKVVLGLALDCLARHYGLSQVARGRARAAMRAWAAASDGAVAFEESAG